MDRDLKKKKKKKKYIMKLIKFLELKGVNIIYISKKGNIIKNIFKTDSIF